MKSAVIATLGFLVTAIPGAAQDIRDGELLADLTFESTDINNRGFVDMGDMEEMRELIFYSMDANEDEDLSIEEFLDWDYGFVLLAEQSGRELARETALRVVHSFWDLNGDGVVSTPEHRRATMSDFRRADLDNDAILTREEFVNAYSVLVALRAALDPDL